MPISRILIILLGVALLPACGWFSKATDETKDWTASEFYARASEALADGSYEQAIKYYELLEARYPFGPYAMQAQLDVAYAYYKYDEPESAIAAADRFIKLHPQHPNVDYAYYLKGLVNFNRNLGFFDRFIPSDPSQRDPGSARESFKDFGELVRRFPDSKYGEDARQRMVYLRNNLAQYDVNVAKYYVRRGAYVAAVERCGYVLETYERAPALKEALVVMSDAYRRLGMDDLAADTQRVLSYNLQRGILPEETKVEKTWGRRLWDFLELDKN